MSAFERREDRERRRERDRKKDRKFVHTCTYKYASVPDRDKVCSYVCIQMYKCSRQKVYFYMRVQHSTGME